MMRRKGFTLVELVVVILILGILAGVAAPKMLNTSKQATTNGVKQTLAIVRDAIELYVAQNGTIPACNATGSDFKLLVAKYIRGSFPKSPLAAAAVADHVKGVANSTADGTTGWLYNTTTGEFICNSTDPTGETGIEYNEL
jgi:general secretion pathway protein G